jgi:hypothetical protein
MEGEMKKFEKKKLKNPMLPEEECLKTHLKGMDEGKKRWYMNAMKIWKKKDYNNYERFHLWMLG